MKRSGVLSAILALVMTITLALSGITAVTAKAADNLVVTLGANLSAEQKASILQFFGVSESEVTILVITNEDEREKLGDLIPLEQIGNQTFSCAMVCPTDANGIQVKTANMNYVTGNMIAATLSTSGVVNCDVLAAAPFEVSGTGALTGVIMAYEQAIGHELDEDKKELANEELVTTNEIGEEIGQDEAILVVNDIKIRIIRDQVPEEEVESTVDEVLGSVGSAASVNAASTVKIADLSQGCREMLYSLGKKISSMNYAYDDVKDSLQRVAQNITEETGIDDPIMDTFEDKISNKIDEDSILNHTDDSALGLTSDDTSTTFEDPSESEVVTFDGNLAGDNVSLTAYSTPDSNDWVYESSFLESRGSNGYGLMSADGSAVTDAIYSYLDGTYYYIDAIISNGTLNDNGLLNKEGEEIIPFDYGYLRLLNEHWAIAFILTDSTEDDYDVRMIGADNEYQQIVTADIYYLEDGQAKLSASLTRDQYADSNAYGKVINIEDRATGAVTAYNADFEAVAEGLNSVYTEPDAEYTGLIQTYRYNGQDGLMDAEGNIIMEAAYQSIYIGENSQLLADTGSLEGVIDRNGKELIPVAFDEVLRTSSLPLDEQYDTTSGYVANGYAAVIKDGQLAFCDYNGNVTYETGLTEDDLGDYTNCGASVIYQDAAGSIHILAADGADTVMDSYYKVSGLEYAGGMLYKVQNEDYSCGIVDWHGNVLFDTKYDRAELSSDGKYLLLYEYSAGSEVFEITYDIPEYEEREAVVSEPQEEKTPAQQLTVGGDITLEEYAYYAVEGLDWIADGNDMKIGWGSSLLYDVDGNAVTDKEYYSYDANYIDYILTESYDEDADVYEEGILNLNGEEIVPVKYDTVDNENEHWALGMILDEGTEDDYDYQSYSDDSYYVIDTADVYYLEDGTASLAATLTRDQIAAWYANGEYLNVTDRSGQTSCYDRDWNVMESGLNSVYTTPSCYVPEYQTYRENGQQGIMDRNGNIIMKAAYKYIYIDNSYAEISDGEYYGLADLQGNVLVPAAYDDIISNYYSPVTRENMGYSSKIANGYAAVELNDMVGFCDVNGNETVAPAYNHDDVDVCGVSLMYTDSDGTEHILAADGVDTAISADYDYVRCLNYGSGMLYSVQDKDYNRGLIDWHGNVLLPLEYDNIDISADGRFLIAENSDGTAVYRIYYSAEEAAEAGVSEQKEDQTESAETETKQETTVEETQPQTEKETTTADAEEKETEPASEASADETQAKILAVLEGTKELVDEDYSGNVEKIRTLLSQAAALIEADYADAAALLNSAVQLIDSGATDAGSVSLLIASAMSMIN